MRNHILMFIGALALAGVLSGVNLAFDAANKREVEDAAFKRGRVEGMCWTIRQMVVAPALKGSDWPSKPATRKVIEACDHEKAGLL